MFIHNQRQRWLLGIFLAGLMANWSCTSRRAALSQLPGVVTVRPGYGVVYVFTDRPAVVPKELDGIPVKALPPEFMNGVSEDWVTPDQLPPPGRGN
jgi:hypothetical protein